MVTGQGWHVRYYQERDDDALVLLLQAAFGGWPSIRAAVAPIEHLRWKLHNHPIALRHHVVTEADGRLVGARLVWAQQVKLGDRMLLLRQPIDACVHPAYQRRGIMAAMRSFEAEAFRREFALHMAQESGHSGIKTLADRDGQRPLANAIELWEHTLDEEPTGRPESPVRVSEARCFDERFDGFWEEASRDFDFAVARTRAYLNWRYADPRAGRFNIRIAEEGETLAGYAVLRMLRGQGYLADLLVLPGRGDAAELLIDDALRFFREAGVERACYWTASRHAYKAAIRNVGFVYRRRRKRIMAYMPLGSTWQDLSILNDASGRVHFTFGDVDNV